MIKTDVSDENSVALSRLATLVAAGHSVEHLGGDDYSVTLEGKGSNNFVGVYLGAYQKVFGSAAGQISVLSSRDNVSLKFSVAEDFDPENIQDPERLKALTDELAL